MSTSTGSDKKIFSVLLVGLSGVGKTTFLDRHVLLCLRNSHLSSDSLDIDYQTSHGAITLKFVEKNEYVEGFDGEIVMMDVTNRLTMTIINDLTKTDKPRVFVGTKHDKAVPKGMVKINLDDRMIICTDNQYYDISAASGLNLEKPILYMLRKLVGDENLTVQTTSN